MGEIIPVLKDEQNQGPVPTAWRRTLVDIVEGLKDGDFERVRGVKTVRPIPAQKAFRIADNIKAYGAHLISLPEQTWKTSVYLWMIGYWHVLVDLYTVEEGASDLVLDVRVYEEGQEFAFEIDLVYVP